MIHVLNKLLFLKRLISFLEKSAANIKISFKKQFHTMNELSEIGRVHIRYRNKKFAL